MAIIITQDNRNFLACLAFEMLMLSSSLRGEDLQAFYFSLTVFFPLGA